MSVTLLEKVELVECKNKIGEQKAWHKDAEKTYFILTSGGVKKEGEQFKAFYTTPNQAWVEWLTRFSNLLLKYQPSEIYWRRVPQLNETLFIETFGSPNNIALMSPVINASGFEPKKFYNVTGRFCFDIPIASEDLDGV